MIVLASLFFCLATGGYRQLAMFLGSNRYLSWLLAIIIQSMMVYLAALIGQLKFGIWLTFLLGMLLFLSTFIKNVCSRETTIKLHVFDAWFIIFGFLMIIALYHSSLIHYDNFSHWATIVKYLTFVGQLPDAHQNLVTFTDYPPATAMFLTYITSIVGYHEGILLIGQFMMIWASAYALFGGLRDPKRAVITASLLTIISLLNIFNIAIRMNNLLVDFLLALLAATGMVAVYCEKKKPKLQSMSVILIVNFLLLTKSSAIYFGILILVYFAITRFKEMSLKVNKIKTIFTVICHIIVTILLSFLGWMYWRLHVAHVFTAASKHALNLQAYENQVSHESQNTKLLIIKKIVAYLFNVDTLFFKGFLLINVALLVTWGIIRFLLHKKSFSFKMLFITNGIILLYIIGVLVMFLVSMPYNEAITLAGIDRYLSTIIVFSITTAGLVILNDCDLASFQPDILLRDAKNFASLRTKQLYQETTFILILIASVLMLSEINGINFNARESRQALPVKLHEMLPNQIKFNHKKILLVDVNASDVANSYTQFVGRYYMFNDQVIGREAFDMSTSKFKDLVSQYDYIVIPEKHQTFSLLAKRAYHQKIGAGIYKSNPDNLQIVSAKKYMNEVNE
ncbi:hypothetical protein ACFQGR_09070 [Weissella sagaensis]|uniref:ABC transporter permease n=1 Tax=Weissella sagaensis TaxID=2559928 RepID=A0ABW1RVK5_9LACO|nr:hypothetical protein [Weissella sagaensis]QDJ58939.1 hypothetical protein EFA59_05100 [Weissella hellenica]QEA57936.1 hypothetical protein FGL75_08620 [Weissella hellenica]UEG67082.1 hypothetical protein GZH44_00725 [Weissella hellenica]